MKCENCQAENPEKSNFCSNCGKRLHTDGSFIIDEHIESLQKKADLS